MTVYFGQFGYLIKGLFVSLIFYNFVLIHFIKAYPNIYFIFAFFWKKMFKHLFTVCVNGLGA